EMPRQEQCLPGMWIGREDPIRRVPAGRVLRWLDLAVGPEEQTVAVIERKRQQQADRQRLGYLAPFPHPVEHDDCTEWDQLRVDERNERPPLPRVSHAAIWREDRIEEADDRLGNGRGPAHFQDESD